MESYSCAFCQRSFPIDLFASFCPSCEEPLLYHDNRTEKKLCLEKEYPLEIALDFLPVSKVNPDLCLGEGNTPLLRLGKTEKALQLPSLYAKNETVNPTHSFKDRGTVVAVQKAVSLGIKRIGTVSTGNMAASTAAYGEKAGLETFILVKEDTPSEKLISIASHNPLLIKVSGDYGELFRKSFSLGKQHNICFMNSVDPFRIEGYKVTAFEIFLQLDQESPDYVFVPVSSGGHLIGIMRAFEDLMEHGYIQQYPHFVGVQAEGSAPIARAFEKNLPKVERIDKAETVAHSISNPDPPAGNLLIRMIRQKGGTMLSVSDRKILKAQSLLSELEGILVQPASATTLAGLLELAKQQKFKQAARIILILTGSGPVASKTAFLPTIRVHHSSLAELSGIIKSISED